MRRFMSKVVTVAALAVVLLGPLSVNAVTVSQDSRFYYQIGGAPSVSQYGTKQDVSVTMAPRLETGYSCGKFNVVENVAHMMDQFKEGLDEMGNALVYGVTGAITSLPTYVMARNMPQLYEVLQNNKLEALQRYRLAVKNCEQIESEIAQGKNPYSEWVTLSRAESWDKQAGSGSTAERVQEKVDANAGKNGATWVGGVAAGGVGQPPAFWIGDTAVAGYNLLLGRSVTDSSAPSGGATKAPLVTTWKTPADARRWVNSVVGEQGVDNAQGVSTPGTGLTPLVQDQQDKVRTDLDNLLKTGDVTTADALKSVSAPGVELDRESLDAINRLSPPARAAAIERLSAEVATARVVNQALMARRILLAGARDTHIGANNPAVKSAHTAVDELEREIKNLLFEDNVRKQMVSGTMQTVLSVDAQNKSYVPSSAPSDDGKPLQSSSPLGGLVVPK